MSDCSPRRRYRFKSTSATGGAEGRQQDLPSFGHIHNICMYWYWYHLFGPGQKHVSFLGPWTWVMLGSLAQNLFSVRFASLLHFKQPWGIRKSLLRRKSRESKREYVWCRCRQFPAAFDITKKRPLQLFCLRFLLSSYCNFLLPSLDRKMQHNCAWINTVHKYTCIRTNSFVFISYCCSLKWPIEAPSISLHSCAIYFWCCLPHLPSVSCLCFAFLHKWAHISNTETTAIWLSFPTICPIWRCILYKQCCREKWKVIAQGTQQIVVVVQRIFLWIFCKKYV